jgi:cytochrome c-type biogenesis protein CcmH/NrfF
LFAGKSNEDIEEDVRNILLKGEEEELPAMTSLIWIFTIPATVLLLSVLILIIRRYRRSAATRLVETSSVAMSMTNLNRQKE